VPKKEKKKLSTDNTTFNESAVSSISVTTVTSAMTQVTPTYTRSHYSSPVDEELEVYNQSFIDKEDIQPQVFFNTPNSTSEENIIGRVIVRKGKVIKYEIDKDLLWKQVLLIIRHRINMSGGTSCLLNLRTISKQITRECNIKSVAAVEGEVIRMVSENFGVKDIDSSKEPRGLKKLRGTIEFWGTVGSRTKHNRKRVARVYAIKEPKKIVKYIEGEINDRG
jgi:hypothetical protein